MIYIFIIIKFRFLRCKPIAIDSEHILRERGQSLYWSNIPNMNTIADEPYESLLYGNIYISVNSM